MSYVTPEQLAKQLAYRDTTDARLQVCCDDASSAIDDRCGMEAPFSPVPPTIQNVALSLAVDIWKQPDATFGIMGLSETGPVRTSRDLVARYDSQLVPFFNGTKAWGVA